MLCLASALPSLVIVCLCTVVSEFLLLQGSMQQSSDAVLKTSDKHITEIAPTRVKQKLLMSRLAQEIMRYEVP